LRHESTRGNLKKRKELGAMAVRPAVTVLLTLLISEALPSRRRRITRVALVAYRSSRNATPLRLMKCVSWKQNRRVSAEHAADIEMLGWRWARSSRFNGHHNRLQRISVFVYTDNAALNLFYIIVSYTGKWLDMKFGSLGCTNEACITFVYVMMILALRCVTRPECAKVDKAAHCLPGV